MKMMMMKMKTTVRSAPDGSDNNWNNWRISGDAPSFDNCGQQESTRDPVIPSFENYGNCLFVA